MCSLCMCLTQENHLGSFGFGLIATEMIRWWFCFGSVMAGLHWQTLPLRPVFDFAEFPLPLSFWIPGYPRFGCGRGC